MRSSGGDTGKLGSVEQSGEGYQGNAGDSEGDYPKPRSHTCLPRNEERLSPEENMETGGRKDSWSDPKNLGSPNVLLCLKPKDISYDSFDAGTSQANLSIPSLHPCIDLNLQISSPRQDPTGPEGRCCRIQYRFLNWTSPATPWYSHLSEKRNHSLFCLLHFLCSWNYFSELSSKPTVRLMAALQKRQPRLICHFF